MREKIFRVRDFNLEITLDSGQVFHWIRDGESWIGLIDQQPVRIRQDGDLLRFGPGSQKALTHYFSLDHPIHTIYGRFPKDPYIQAAKKACLGMRVIRQPLWECLATFLFSSMKQVAHIRQIGFRLRERYGKPIPDWPIAAFPDAATLARVSISDLKDCSLGYRAEHLRQSASLIANGEFPLESLKKLPTPEARKQLCQLPGIGPKIANCVLLFGLGRLECIPVDVWIGRILRGLLQPANPSPAELEKEAARLLGGYGGYVQQYIFHYARHHRILPEAA